MPRRARAFGLIELLVAVAIIAVIATLAVAAVGSAGGQRQSEREAERLSALVTLACERAALGGRPYGLHFGRGGYAFSRRFGADWRVERDNELRARAMPEGMEIAVLRAGVPIPLEREPARDPLGWCHPSGELAPLVLSIGPAGAQPLVRITLDASGRVTTSQGR